MDRNRLSEVRQTDLTESRVNEEFVDWLKNKGPTYLLVGLVAILAVLFFMRFRERQHEREVNAWDEFRSAALPSALEDIAREYEDVDSIAVLARLQAADSLLTSVQADFPLEADPNTDPDVVITDGEREEQLARAADLYADVVEADDGSLGMTLIVVNALNGQAAVAEAQGNLGEAGDYYQAAAERAEEHFPDLAARARERAATAGEMEAMGKFPTDAEIQPLRADPATGDPINVDPAFSELLLSPVGGAD